MKKQDSAMSDPGEPDREPVHTAFTESMIDETLRESFPASDPPGWCLGTQIGIPHVIRFEPQDEEKAADAP